MIFFSACNDSFNEYEEKPSYPNGGKAYFALNLHVPKTGENTRAGYNEGENSEHVISRDLDDHFVIGFDENGKFFLIGDFIDMEDEEENSNGSTTKTVRSIINVDLPKKGDPKLKYLFFVINGKNLKSKIKTELTTGMDADILSLLDFKWGGEGEQGYSSMGFNSTTSDSEGYKYFTMTNSMYIDGSEGNYKLGGQTDISSLSLFSTVEEAKANSQDILDVYVDRLLAKFSVNFNESKFIATKTGYLSKQNTKLRVKNGDNPPVETSWAINFIGLGVNGVEQTTYLYRKISSPDILSFPKISSMPAFYAGWNDGANYRSYWAIDANYSGGKYPKQQRKVLTPGISLTSLETLQDPSLHYRSWNQLNSNFVNVYSVENTFSGEEIDPTAYLNAATHLIVGAQILFGNEIPENPDASTMIDNISTKYRDYNGIWYNEENQLKQALLLSITEALSSCDYQVEIPYYKQFEELPLNENDYISIEGNNLKIKKSIKGSKLIINNSEATQNDFQLAKAYTVHGDGAGVLIPQIIGEDGSVNISLEIPESSGGKTILPLTANILVSFAYHYAKTVECYTDGLMFYVATIPHNNKIDPSNETIGDYGVVRNHWYNLKVQDVTNIGTPIHDVNQPIVPQLETKLDISWDVSPWTIKEVTIPPFN